MFYNLEGIIKEINPDSVCIDINGIGFEVFASSYTISSLNLKEKASLYIVESIGESNFDLYGFSSQIEKKLYKLLVSVSGIGPKAAMAILSFNTPESLIMAVVSGDEKSLTSAPGIGKKTASRVILELKDKLAKEVPANDAGIKTSIIKSSADISAYEKAKAALVALGYSNSEITAVVNQIDINGLNTEQIVKSVLKFM